MSDDCLTTNIVYLDEGQKEGGIAHPTQDLIQELREQISVEETLITQPRSNNPSYWYNLGRHSADGADVVHIQFEYGSFGAIGGSFLGSMFPAFAYAVDVPIVTTLHNFRDRRIRVSLADPATIVQFIAEHATWFVDRSLVRHTDFFVPLMRTEEELLARHGVPADRVEYIPLVPEMDVTFRNSASCKRELGVDRKQVVTAFGWVRRTKGYDRVIDVLPMLPDDTVFVIAGGTRTDQQQAYMDDLKRMVAERNLDDSVVFTGYVDREQHSTIMNATDVMVLPYRDNRASDALARTLSYHLPVVSSNNLEFSAVEQEWGCVRTVSSDDELAAALTEVLQNDEERRRLRKAAENYADNMNWASVAERMLNIYRTVTENK